MLSNIFMLKPTDNFLNWYKSCCNLDLNIYRTIKFNKNKAKLIFCSSTNFDFILYPLNGTQDIFYGSENLCKEYIEKNLNTKFLIFSFKNDAEKCYVISNEKVKII